MKFLPLRKLDHINRALVFDTHDCRVIGGCEIYTTKAAGGDKKLYRAISDTLSSRYEADLRLSEELSPPSEAKVQSKAVYQTLHSPFGPLDQVSARKTFAYMIATLNASHPDYDFSSVLRPDDFRKVKDVRDVFNSVNTTLFNLGVNVSQAIPRMWDTIDSEMDLNQCNIYQYAPEETSGDPYSEDGLIWSSVYFFFNKHRKRVCYLYMRGISALSHSPIEVSAWSLNEMMHDAAVESDSGESDDTWNDSRSIWGDDSGYDDIDQMEM